MFNTFEHTMSLNELQSLLNTPEMGAGDLMRCALGAKTTEIEAYCLLVNKGPLSIQDAAEYLGKSRSTVQRLLQGLVEKGIATREERLIGLGGYKYIYNAVSPEFLQRSIMKKLDRWYERMSEELENLPEKIETLGCSAVKNGLDIS